MAGRRDAIPQAKEGTNAKRGAEHIDYSRREITMGEIEIQGTTFVADRFGGVMEWGTNLHYDGRGYQLDNNGRRVALTSYEAFGADGHAREYASRWCAKAQRALEVLV